jgi:two-component system KDP operon response regulator KdpE
MSAEPGGEYEILLIEGDPDILWLTQKALTFHGYAAIATATLAEGRAWLSATNPDLVVLDNRMPDGNGIDFLRELRETSSVPVIMMTSLLWAIYEEATEAGCDDFVEMPFTTDDLTTRIEKILSGASRDAPGKPGIGLTVR